LFHISIGETKRYHRFDQMLAADGYLRHCRGGESAFSKREQEIRIAAAEDQGAKMSMSGIATSRFQTDLPTSDTATISMKLKDNTSVPSSGASRPPIAIVGIGCRFPGGITCPKTFWRLLQDGVDAIKEIPPDRMDVSGYYDPRPATPGKMITRWGGYLEQIDMFDADFFRISPREADRLDPQQRLLLEVAWEALEDAGQIPDRLAGTTAGVFIGLWISDYENRLLANPSSVDFHMTMGTGRYSASGRLSYVFGLQGPSLTVDTACSSSLVAVHLACQSLWTQECSMALAGGANVILRPQIHIAYSQPKMMAPDGRCKFGDAGANGYVRSEGAGIVILKPLAAALEDGDPVYAVIRGTAVNNDGSKTGYMTTPARHGQEKLLGHAYREAGVSPGQVRYVEAHGAGTRAGDPVEVGALASVLSSDRPPGEVCYVGSVKTNFGHTEAASGIAGLIKTALVLKHRVIPASLHVRELNPAIPWQEGGLVIPRKSTPWPGTETAIAGVNGFGITGTNAHIVLEEAPGDHDGHGSLPLSDPDCLLPLSARSPEALVSLARAYLSAMEDEEAASLQDICFTAGSRRTHHEHRLALVVRNRAEVTGCLKAFLRGELPPGLRMGRAEPDRERKVVFVCPGQGSQWVGMGRQLRQRETVFRESIERCEQAMRPLVDWSLEEQLTLDPGNPGYRLGDIDVIQPTLLSIEIALAALWRSWGVEPDAVVGHSMGEAAAGFIAGVLSLEDTMRIICVRSQLLRRVSGNGAMAVVSLPMEEAEAELTGLEHRISVAVSNSPRSTVLSGDPTAIGTILEKLQARDIFCRLVKVDVASHSPQTELLTDELLRALDGIRAGDATIPIYSTVIANRIDGRGLDAPYWTGNLRRPVLFYNTVRRLAEDGHTVFIELSPHPVLTPSVEETLHDLGREGYAIPSLEREKDEQATILSSLGWLYTIGYPVNWKRLFPFGGKVVPLPAYPWQRQHYWLDAQPVQASYSSGLPDWRTAGNHYASPLGRRLPDVASLPGSFVWQNRLQDPAFREFLRKHQIDGSPLPEAVYLEMASAAAKEAFGEKLLRISDLELHEPLVLPDVADAQLQFILTKCGPGLASFQVFSRESDSAKDWAVHVSGKIEVLQADANWLYDLKWEKKPRQCTNLQPPTGRIGKWLIFADREGLGSNLAELLEARGDDCVLVFPGDSFQIQEPRRFRIAPSRKEDMTRLLSELPGAEPSSGWGAIYLWGLDSVSTPGMTASSLQSAQSFSCDAVLHLIQSLSQMGWKPAPRLWLITRNAQAVEPADGISLSVAQAPLWGLGRVIALEYPELWGGLVDLGPHEHTASGDGEIPVTLYEEILGYDGEDQVALREERYVARLVRSHDCAVRTRALAILPDASYLITGGLGSLGLRLAEWLVVQGARNLVLTGRTGLPPRSAWPTISPVTEMGKRIAAIQALEQRGAKIHVGKADVADERQMSELWEDLDRNHPPVRGIIHAAGILTPHGLADLRAEEFHEVLRSKVTGAWLLHQFTEARKTAGKGVDFFVLFSSGASVWGGHGLAHYAAANQFLDALSQHRAALGIPVLSVNWGWWAGAGLVKEELAGLFGRIGLKSLPPEQALTVLAYLLESGVSHKTVADVDWRVFGPIFEARRNRPLLDKVAVRPQPQEESGNKREEKRSLLLDRIEQAPWTEKRPLLHSYIRNEVAEILGFSSSDRIDPKQGFFKMGMDSVMTVQLRNRLDQDLGCSLPPTVAFEYPTVESLTKFLGETVLNLEEPLVAPVATGFEEKIKAAATATDSLSDDQLEELLARKLEQIP
jgi:acyl transferase domain-containing protein/acyl carrier protein